MLQHVFVPQDPTTRKRRRKEERLDVFRADPRDQPASLAFVMARNSPPPLPDRLGDVSPQMNINRELLKLMRPGRIGGNRR